MTISSIIIVGAIVGIITAGLSIRFDRFFVMLLLLFLAGVAIKDAVNIFLVVIFLGAILILAENKSNLKNIPSDNKIKFLTIVPLAAAIFSWLGTWVFFLSSARVLILTLGVLTTLYGLRLIFIHFKDKEKNQNQPQADIVKLCGLFGPIISGFFIGFIGTSLKSLKIPFAVKVGKMSLPQVYLGNVITSAYAALFAIIWRILFFGVNQIYFLAYGVIIWGVVQAISDMTLSFFPESWKKVFQVVIGIILLVAAIKVFGLV